MLGWTLEIQLICAYRISVLFACLVHFCSLLIFSHICNFKFGKFHSNKLRTEKSIQNKITSKFEV